MSKFPRRNFLAILLILLTSVQSAFSVEFSTIVISKDTVVTPTVNLTSRTTAATTPTNSTIIALETKVPPSGSGLIRTTSQVTKSSILLTGRIASAPTTSITSPATYTLTGRVSNMSSATSTFGTRPPPQTDHQAAVDVEIVGPAVWRYGSYATFWISVENMGDTDTYGVLLSIEIPASIAFSLRDVNVPVVPGVDFSKVPLGAVKGPSRILPIWIYDLPKFSSRLFGLNLRAPLTGVQVQISAIVSRSPPDEFAQTGNFTKISANPVAYALAFSYASSTMSGFEPVSPSEFSQKLPVWFEQNRDQIRLVPYCYLAVGAAAGILHNSIPEQVANWLCDPWLDTTSTLSTATMPLSATTLSVRPSSAQNPKMWYGNYCGGSDFPSSGTPIDAFDESCLKWKVCQDSLPPLSHPLVTAGGTMRDDPVSQAWRNCFVQWCNNINDLYGTVSPEADKIIQFQHTGDWGACNRNPPWPGGNILFPRTPPPPFRTRAKSAYFHAVGSGDPNNKSGPEGIGLERFIGQGQKLLYLIHFENLANATASAVNIVVTDRLDPNLDWETVTIGPTSPPNQASIQFDNTNGVITWTFANIDLPPNRNAPEGEGWVLFSVSPRWDLPSGTQLGNNATISFDLNPPMTTQQWTNTIDGTNPTSQVLPLTMVQDNSTFKVRWSGSDTGSGILDYSIFVSENTRPYTLWLASTNYTSANFTGKPNTSYSFYSIARDETGNTESPPVNPDAETTTPAQRDTVGPTLSTPASITVEATASSGAAVIYTASGLDDVDGPVPVSCTPPSGSTFPVGISVVTCKATDKAGNTSASTFTVTVTKTGTIPGKVFDVSPQLFYGLTALGATLAILLAIVGVRRKKGRNRG